MIEDGNERVESVEEAAVDDGEDEWEPESPVEEAE